MLWLMKKVISNEKIRFGSYLKNNGFIAYKQNCVVIPGPNGIEIRDLKTGYKRTLNKKGR